MRDEDSDTVFDGLQPGVLKRPWQAVNGGVQADLVGHSQDVVPQSKRLCLPNSTENSELMQQAVSSAPLLLSDGISGFGFSTSVSDFLGSAPMANDFSEISGFNSSLPLSQYPPISLGDQLAQYDMFSSWHTPLSCYTGELKPTEQFQVLGEAEQAFECQESSEWLSTEDVGSDNLARQPEMPQEFLSGLPGIASSSLQGGQVSMKTTPDASFWTNYETSTFGMCEMDFLSQQPIDVGKDIDPYSQISSIQNSPSNQIGEYAEPENFKYSLVGECESPPRMEIAIEGPIKKDTLDGPADYDSAQQQQHVTQNQRYTDDTQLAQAEGSSPAEYDTCFGMIQTVIGRLQDDFARNNSESDQEVTLKVYQNIVTIHDAQSKKYGGLVDHDTAQALALLSREHSVTFTAMLKAADSCTKKRRQKIQHTLRIVIYGFHRDSDAIGTLLSENKLYLQQPNSFDFSVAYFNPQYLLKPGSEFKVPAQEDVEGSKRKNQMNQAAKSQVLQLFDTATGPVSFSEVQVSKRLITDLKSYQKKALAMMVEKESGRLLNQEFPSLWEQKTFNGGLKRYWNSVTCTSQVHPPSLCLGGLLADDMGLGKTLTTLALIAGSIDRFEEKRKTTTVSTGSGVLNSKNTTLIVTPLSTLSTWEEQIKAHFKSGSITYLLYRGAEKEREISDVLKHTLVITTYDTLRADSTDSAKRRIKSSGLLHSIEWYRVVLDEAHVIRNRSSQLFHSVSILRARHRWCLTGTPIQNRVEDFGALIEFLRAYPFDNPSQFRSHFINTTETRKETGMVKLKALVQAISLRRTKETVFHELSLGARTERMQSIELNDEERVIYNIIKKTGSRAIGSSTAMRSIFQTILKLRQICNHGRELLNSETLRLLDGGYFDEDSSIATSRECCKNCGQVVQDHPDGNLDSLLSCFHLICNKCLSSCQGDPNTEERACPICSGAYLATEDEQSDQASRDSMDIDILYNPSSKVCTLIQNLRTDQSESGGDVIKSVVFTCWTRMLDLIGRALTSEGFDFERIDGRKSLSHRRQAIRTFRNNPSCTILLASIGSAGVGLDLTAASRVHLMEPQWNPMAEEQALDRIYRLGQTQEVVATRYIVRDSIEEYILQTQKGKYDLIQASFGYGSSSRADIIKARLKDLQTVLQ